jgi:hypothetical protein
VSLSRVISIFIRSIRATLWSLRLPCWLARYLKKLSFIFISPQAKERMSRSPVYLEWKARLVNKSPTWIPKLAAMISTTKKHMSGRPRNQLWTIIANQKNELRKDQGCYTRRSRQVPAIIGAEKCYAAVLLAQKRDIHEVHRTSRWEQNYYWTSLIAATMNKTEGNMDNRGARLILPLVNSLAGIAHRKIWLRVAPTCSGSTVPDVPVDLLQS